MEERSKKEIFEEMFDEYSDAIFRHCFFRVSDRERAKDMTQDIFLRFWRAIQKENIENEKAFIYRIANNLIIDHYRKGHYTISLNNLQDAGYEPVSTENDVTIQSEINILLKALKGARKGDREIFIMRYIDELSPQEIAEVVGKSENAVSVRLHRAMKRIKEIIGEI